LDSYGGGLVEVPLKEFGGVEVFLVGVAALGFFGVGDGFVEIVPWDGSRGWGKGKIKGDAKLWEKEARSFVFDGRMLVREAKGMPGAHCPERRPAKKHRKTFPRKAILQEPERWVLRKEKPLLHIQPPKSVGPNPGMQTPEAF
jgi:hypothetical protein